MKVVKLKGKNAFKITVEDLEDLMYLDKIIKPGDEIGKVDFRTTSKGERGEKIKTYIRISVEQIKKDVSGKKVKILGKITYSSREDILYGYHSFEIKESDSFELIKAHLDDVFWEITNYLKKRQKFNALAVVIDHKEATFGEIKNNTIDLLFEIKNKSKKGVEEGGEYYKEVGKKILDMCERYNVVILAGPGFAKYEIEKMIKDKVKYVIGDTSVTGFTGLLEIIRRGLLEKALKTKIVEEEIKEIEKFFECINKGKETCAYGIKQIKNAAEIGAIDKLIICYEILDKEDISKIVEQTIKNRGEIIIIDKINPYYNQIKYLGGMIALLRFSIS